VRCAAPGKSARAPRRWAASGWSWPPGCTAGWRRRFTSAPWPAAGQNAAQGLLAEAVAQAPVLIAEALALDPAAIGGFNPWWDIASARHETADGRLFIS
jgi:hypothetical protein